MRALKINDYASKQLDDSVVTQRVIAGEKELFEILMRRYNQTLYRVIRGYLKDQKEIQDAMQNTYLKAFDKLYQFQGNSSFSTWLIRIGMNEALARIKNIKKDNLVYLNSGDTGKEMFNQIPDKQMNPEKKFIHQEAQQMLEHAIDALPEKYRVVYILKEIEGLTNEEVEKTVGITESNIKVRLHRAKLLLKDSLYKLSLPSQVFEFRNNRCDEIVKFVMEAI